MVIKISPGGQACRWRAINFEIHLWSSGKNADCIFGDRSASSMSKWRPAWTLTPEMIHFRTKSVTLSMLIDLLIIVHVDRRRWRAHQLTYDLKRCLLFRKCLRFFESESSFGAYVCHRRPGGSMATSHLVVLCNLQANHRDKTPPPRKSTQCRWWAQTFFYYVDSVIKGNYVFYHAVIRREFHFFFLWEQKKIRLSNPAWTLTSEMVPFSRDRGWFLKPQRFATKLLL